MSFSKATKQALSIKLAISGTAGSGKTFSALRLASGLGGRIAVLDTEGQSASLYADYFDFDNYDRIHPEGFPPEYFIQAIQAAEQAGYRTLIIDSLSHEWMGRGGCLELADKLANTNRYRGNTFAAWAMITPRHQALIDTILNARINIVATLRSKTEYAVEQAKGKTTVNKLGLAPVQRDGLDYEFTVVFDLDRETHTAMATKDRTKLFTNPHIITEETGQRIDAWLTKAEPAPKPKPAPKPVPKPKPAPKPAPKPTKEPQGNVAEALEYLKTQHQRWAEIMTEDAILAMYQQAANIHMKNVDYDTWPPDTILQLARSLYRQEKKNPL